MQYSISVSICITLKNKACAFWTFIMPLQDCNHRRNSHGVTTFLPPSGWHASPSSPLFVVSLQLLSYSAVDTDNITLATSPLWFGWYRPVRINGILTGSLGSWQTSSWDFFPWPKFGGLMSRNSVSFLSTFKTVSVNCLKNGRMT